MSRRYAYGPQEKAMERQRSHGSFLANEDWEAGHRESLRHRDAESWNALTACEKTGYVRRWVRLDFAFRQSWCVAHHHFEPCSYCRLDARETPEPVELTRERIGMAEAW